jgi:hypothetical protein
VHTEIVYVSLASSARRVLRPYPYHFPLISCHTFTENLLRNPLVSMTGRITLMKVEAKTQMNEITIQPVKKPREKM